MLFPARGRDTPLNGWSKNLLDLRKRSGVYEFHLHDLRRSWASFNAQWTAPHVLEKALSHVSGQISGVAAIYNRYSYEAELLDCYTIWEARLKQIIDGP